METVTDFIFLGSKITADSDCDHEIKMLAPWKKSHDRPRQHIKKQKHYFANKSPSSKSSGFSSSCVWMLELDYWENWALKDWFCWTVVLKTLESPLQGDQTARRSNQSIRNEISPEYSLGGLMLKLQYFGHLMWRTNWFEKTLMLGKIEGRRRKGWQRMRWLDGIKDSMDMSLGKSESWWWTGRLGVLQFIGLQRVGQDWVTELKARTCTCQFREVFW